ncbi:DUF995 domain-containing protein [Alphaproteobacteria bacterium]|nr:DUF995 domain-containing protein [Alphaproteobacteria bacterium]
MLSSRISKFIAIFGSVVLIGSQAMAKTDLEKDIEAGAQTMTQSEMFELFENNTITGFNAQTDKLHGKSYFPKDKKVISLKKGQKKEGPKWRIDGVGQMCYEIKKKWQCAHYYKIDGKIMTYLKKDGSRRLYLTSENGNTL